MCVVLCVSDLKKKEILFLHSTSHIYEIFSFVSASEFFGPHLKKKCNSVSKTIEKTNVPFFTSDITYTTIAIAKG